MTRRVVVAVTNANQSGGGRRLLQRSGDRCLARAEHDDLWIDLARHDRQNSRALLPVGRVTMTASGTPSSSRQGRVDTLEDRGPVGPAGESRSPASSSPRACGRARGPSGVPDGRCRSVRDPGQVSPTYGGSAPSRPKPPCGVTDLVGVVGDTATTASARAIRPRQRIGAAVPLEVARSRADRPSHDPRSKP